MKNLNNLVYLIKYATAEGQPAKPDAKPAETPASTPAATPAATETKPAAPATADTEQSIYDQAVNWIKENPWTAGAGALGLGGLGYYLLSDDDDEEEEEE